MPTYVYKFLDCEGTIEVQQPFTDDALTEAAHPEDGLLHPVKKVITPVGVTFKGNGFYKTDSRGSSKSGSASSASKSENGSSTTSSESSGSTTPAAAASPTTGSSSSSSSSSSSTD
jgi:predicted nucleic acid-binding Zn ribbon protein